MAAISFARSTTTQIAVAANVHDMSGLEAMLAGPSPDDAAAMERRGVVQPVTVYVEK